MGLLSRLLVAASEADAVHFSAETPVTKEFRGDARLLDLQRTLAACVCR